MIRVLRGVLLLVLLAALAGCSTAEIVVPLPKVAVEVSGPQRSERVLLIVSEELQSAYHESPQLLSVFQYELGSYLPFAIRDSLGASFAHVDTSSDEDDPSQYDLVVTPELVSFEAPVPATVFARTKVTLEIAYHLSLPQTGTEAVVTALGDYRFRSEADENYYNSIDISVPDIYYYDASSGIGGNIPNYTGLAGKDVAIALKECLEELNIAVAEALAEGE